MNHEEKNISDGGSINQNENHNKNEFAKDEHKNLEDRLEELLKIGWTMLPESCPSPCNFFI